MDTGKTDGDIGEVDRGPGLAAQDFQDKLTAGNGPTQSLFRGRTADSGYIDINGNIQNAVATDIAQNKRTDDAAAKKWLDAHPDVWKAWLPTS